MQPRLITQASAAALSINAKTVHFPRVDTTVFAVLDNAAALLVEEFALHPVRIANHVKRPAPQVREDGIGEIGVVLDQVAFCQASPREEDLVRVADRDVHGPESCSVLLNKRAR